ncbi:MAG: hypothetical protein NW214_01415 [Pseudanabaenaceae cyanobacterium bins.39]|nr:hypothetical protein [Pseudanabaenaceae cyanobacterium bins.39]
MQITGTVEYIDIGTGTWAIATSDGTQYEIWQPAPTELLQEGLRVKVSAQMRDDVMSIAAIGDVIEIKSFQVSQI